jgi:pimeloyl-ACP methyl ester carboxylesterase
MEIDPDCGAIAALGDRIVRSMDRAGMERAVVGGNSLGGHIALRMALRHPDRVAGLVLTGSSGLFERGFERAVPRRPTENWIRDKMRGIFHDPLHVTAELVSELCAFLGNMRNVIHMIRIARCAKHDSVRDELPSITCPVLLVWGRNDEITPLETANEFHDLLPASELQLIDECGHVPMVEHPDKFNDLLAAFLLRISGGAAGEPATLEKSAGNSLQFARA